MTKLKFDFKNALDFMSEDELTMLSDAALAAHDALEDGSGAVNDFTGWLRLP